MSKNYLTSSAPRKAARLLTNTRRRDHTSPVLASLHLLPVHLRINFKITVKALHGLAPSYIADLLLPCEAEHSLGSSGRALLAISKSQLKLKAFRVRAPQLWNSKNAMHRIQAICYCGRSLA